MQGEEAATGKRLAGVFRAARGPHWVARVWLNGHWRIIGWRYRSAAAAAEAVDRAKIALQGRAAATRLNFPLDSYDAQVCPS